MTSCGYQIPKKSVPTIFTDEAHTGSGHCMCARTSFLSHYTEGCGCHAWQTKGIAQLSSFAAALITHNCSLLALEIFVAYPC